MVSPFINSNIDNISKNISHTYIHACINCHHHHHEDHQYKIVFLPKGYFFKKNLSYHYSKATCTRGMNNCCCVIKYLSFTKWQAGSFENHSSLVKSVRKHLQFDLILKPHFKKTHNFVTLIQIHYTTNVTLS